MKKYGHALDAVDSIISNREEYNSPEADKTEESCQIDDVDKRYLYPVCS